MFFELIRKRQFTLAQLDVPADYFEKFSEANPAEIQLIGLKHLNLSKASKEIADALWAKDVGEEDTVDLDKNIADLAEVDFVHLHNHSQFSVLQSTMSVKDLVQLAVNEGMPAVGLTDHGNMMGAFHL